MARREQRPSGNPPALAQAHALWDQRRFDEAIRQFNEAVRQAPNDLRVLIEASRALGLRYQVERSLSLLERALRLGARRYEVQHAVGESYRALGRTAEAESCFRRACRLADHPASQLELARICERRHALDEAAALTASALARQPELLPALLLRGRVERRRGLVDEAEATLRQVIARSGPNPQLAAEACGELATLLDAAGRYDEAWDAILQGKELQLPRSGDDWSVAQFVLGRAGRMIDAVRAEDFARWRATDAPPCPQRVALLTGFPRSGTTLLEQVLDAHPGAVSAEEKEVFSAEIFPWLGEGRPADSPIIPILDELDAKQILAARDMYLAAMQATLAAPIGDRLLVDKNPAMNLMIPPMRRLFPEMKLLVALRDPRDVVVSCFMRCLPLNPVSVCFLTLQRTADRYVLDIEAWLKLRKMIGDWAEVRYEDTVADLPGEARRALATLELPWDDAVLAYRERAKQKPVRSPTYEAVAKPVFSTSVGRWRNYERQLAPVLDRLSPLVRALGYDA